MVDDNKKIVREVDLTSERSLALVADLLIMTDTGEPALNMACELMARLRGTNRAFVVLVYHSEAYFIGRYGYPRISYAVPIEVQPNWRGDEQVEYLDVDREIAGRQTYPQDLRESQYLHFAPLKIDGIPIGMVGVANRDPLPPATLDQRVALDLLCKLVAERLHHHRLLKRHTRELFGLLQGDAP
ncbi:GAF domain-containing protein [Rhodovulum bhavnagarense]|uniref:GAF domain-containing protein n=1 Tax=Rhodovulum bhavnagarense TaxID=992286 RepID=A0A4R2RG20_9RHOB|nr:GAF domain-containing protein [Rhodovulum bhavnagarense]TCP61309.1 GAF domain-containing protein [Rhodovulum bhavnagarense]